MDLSFDPKTGLIPAIAQDRLTGEIRMVAWMNQEALDRTIETRLATFYSRSRQKLWVKGESSGNALKVHEVFVDCDADVVLVLCDPEGPSCHTGRPSCFFRRIDTKEPPGVGSAPRGSEAELIPALPYAQELEHVIEARSRSTSEKSYTKSLLDAGIAKISGKIEEEAAELTRALAGESDERALSEAADLVFHVLVGLRARGLPLRGVLEKLAARSSQSGHAEKASRPPKS